MFMIRSSALKKQSRLLLASALALIATGGSAFAITAQQAVETEVEALTAPKSKTIITASAAILAQAVGDAIQHHPELAAKDIAAAAFEPYPAGDPKPKVRGDRNKSAGLVVQSAITTTLATQTPTSQDIADIAHNVAVVGGTNTKINLTDAGRIAVAKGALIADASAAQQIGQTLALDMSIKTTKTAFAAGAITGVFANAGTAETGANDFVKGVLSSTGGITDSAEVFAGKVAAAAKANNNVVAQVANATVAFFGSNQQVSISAAVIKAAPKAAAETSRRVAQLIAPSAGQADRITFATALVNTKGFASYSALIAQGVSLTDPEFAGVITKAVVAANSSTLALAPKIAVSVANMVDGEDASEVSNELGKLVEAGTLKVSTAATIAKSIAGTQFVVNSQLDIEATASSMTQHLINLFQTANGINDKANKAILAAVYNVGKMVAKVSTAFAKKSSSTNFSDVVAGAVTDSIMGVISNLSSTDQDTIIAALKKAVTSATPPAFDPSVSAAIDNARNNNGNQYQVGPVVDQETPTTNF